MSKFDHKIEEIFKHHERLSVSLEYDEDPDKTFPVIFYCPDMMQPEHHYHIHLTNEQADKLGRWLVRNSIV